MPVTRTCLPRGESQAIAPWDTGYKYLATEHTAEFTRRYRKRGGMIKATVKKGGKDHPHSLNNPG